MKSPLAESYTVKNQNHIFITFVTVTLMIICDVTLTGCAISIVNNVSRIVQQLHILNEKKGSYSSEFK